MNSANVTAPLPRRGRRAIVGRVWLTCLGLFCTVAMAATVAGAGPTNPWDRETRLVTSPVDIWWRDIAADGETVHLIWGEQPLRYRRSDDQGATWSDDVVLADVGTPVLTDALVAEGVDVGVAYLRNTRREHDWCCERPLGDIYFRHSGDGGRTWQAERRLGEAGSTLRLSLAVAGPRLHLVWMDYRSGRWDIFYRRSDDRGSTWQPEVRLVQGHSGFGAERPQIAASGDSVHVVWMDDRDRHPPCYTTPACPEVYYKRSMDGGITWQADVRLTEGAPFSGRPDIAALDATVIVAFDDDRDDNRGHEEYVIRSVDGGATWGDPERLSFAPGASNHPDLVAGGSDVHLAWFDARDELTPEIYFRTSHDLGERWLPEERVSHAPGDSVTPLMAQTNDYVHVIWLDRRNGANEIWYRRRVREPDPARPNQQ